MFDYIRVIVVEMHEAPVTLSIDSISELEDRYSHVVPSVMLILDKDIDELITIFNTKNKTLDQLKTIIETFNQR